MTGNRWVPLFEAVLGELLQGLPHVGGAPARPGNTSAKQGVNKKLHARQFTNLDRKFTNFYL